MVGKQKPWLILKRISASLGRIKREQKPKKNKKERREKKKKKKEEKARKLGSSWNVPILEDFEVSKVSI